MKITASTEELRDIAERHYQAAREMVGGTYPPEHQTEVRMRIDLEYRLIDEALKKSRLVQIVLPDPLIEVPEELEPKAPKANYPEPRRAVKAKSAAKVPKKKRKRSEPVSDYYLRGQVLDLLMLKPQTISDLVRKTRSYRKRIDSMVDKVCAPNNRKDLGRREGVLMPDSRGRRRPAVAFGRKSDLKKLKPA